MVARPMTNQPFFTRDHDAFIPTKVANGPWDPNSLHGRVIIGLLAFAIEQRHGADDFLPARLPVDMFRRPNLAPTEGKTKLVRDGLRIKVVEADFFSGGVAMARASCQLLRKTEDPQGEVWSPPNWEVPAPADIAIPEDPRLGMHGKWATRPITGAMGTVGPRRLWMSEVRDLVEGIALTPFVRVAVAADFASPFPNAGEKGLPTKRPDPPRSLASHSVPPLYLTPLPATRWIVFDVVNHHASSGFANREGYLFI